MVIDKDHGCVKLEYYPFSDKTMSFIVWFDNAEHAAKAHYLIRDAGIAVSELNSYTRAFIIEHLNVLSDVDIYKPLPSKFTLEGNGIKVDYLDSEMRLEFSGI